MHSVAVLRWVRRATLWCCMALLALPQARAQDDPPGRVGRLAVLQGEAWVFEPEQGEWVAALLNRPITGGDRITTAEGASIELQIGSTTLLLGSQTEFEALRLDDERLQFSLKRGQLALLLRSPEVAAELELLHPEARFQPLRAGLYRVDRLAEASDAVVLRGELKVVGHNLSMTLHAGQRAAFWRDGALGDTTRQWLTQQHDEFAVAMQRLEQATRSAGAPYLPAEMTGIEDLDRHGQWQQHPQYGAVWSPTVVAIDWVPFRDGRWVWLRPWGWTWVDAAPWGFAPSHYGRWLWWGNRWHWAPGPRVPRPVFSPGLVGWVGAPPHAGVPGKRPMPGSGWLPLGPHEAYRPAYRVSPGHLQRLNPPLPPGPAQRPVPGAVTHWNGPFHGPARHPREFVAPRPATPVQMPMPMPMPKAPLPIAPQLPAADVAARPRPPGPMHGQAAPAAAIVAPAPVAQVVAPKPMPAGAAMPAHKPAPPPQPQQPAQPTQAAERGTAAKGPFSAEPGDRRRTPESRYTPRER